jgi:hypothetical protein
VKGTVWLFRLTSLHLLTGETELKRDDGRQLHVPSALRHGTEAEPQPPVEIDRTSTPLATPSVASWRKKARSVFGEAAKTPAYAVPVWPDESCASCMEVIDAGWSGCETGGGCFMSVGLNIDMRE